MSEAELYLIKMRLEGGRMNQVRRGDFKQRLPAGLERLADGTVVKDPDAQVRETIELVFKKFMELGSCAKVLCYLVEEKSSCRVDSQMEQLFSWNLPAVPSQKC